MADYHLYVSTKDFALMEEFKKIAQREGKTMAGLLKEILVNYVKAHKEGNSTFELTKWVNNPNFHVVPTIAEMWSCEMLSKLDDKELEDLDHNLHIRHDELDAEIRKRSKVML